MKNKIKMLVIRVFEIFYFALMGVDIRKVWKR